MASEVGYEQHDPTLVTSLHGNQQDAFVASFHLPRTRTHNSSRLSETHACTMHDLPSGEAMLFFKNC
jgi:hypothetical protein